MFDPIGGRINLALAAMNTPPPSALLAFERALALNPCAKELVQDIEKMRKNVTTTVH